MKPRGRRVTLITAALGMGLVGMLTLANWENVRNRVEMWLRAASALDADDVREVVVKRVGGYQERIVRNQDDIARVVGWLRILHLSDRDDGFGVDMKKQFIAPSGWLTFVLTSGDEQEMTLWYQHITWEKQHYKVQRGYINRDYSPGSWLKTKKPFQVPCFQGKWCEANPETEVFCWVKLDPSSSSRHSTARSRSGQGMSASLPTRGSSS